MLGHSSGRRGLNSVSARSTTSAVVDDITSPETRAMAPSCRSGARRWQAPVGEATTTVSEPSGRQPELLPEAGGHLEVLLSREGHVEDVEVLLRQADAPEAVVAVGEVAAHHEIRRVGAGLALEEVSRGLAALALHAVAAVAASLGGHAVGALVATHAVPAEHAVRAALAILAGVAPRVARVGGEGATQRSELVEELAAAEASHRSAGLG